MLKWGTRTFLVVVAVLGIWLEMTGVNFFQRMTSTIGVYGSSFLIFISVIAFFPLFYRSKRHDIYGGEIVNKKLTAIVAIFIGVIVVMVYLSISQPGLIGEKFTQFGGVLGVAVMNGWNSMKASPIYQQYGLPIGLAGGALFALFFANWFWPRVHHKVPSQPKPAYMGEPKYIPPTAIQPANQPTVQPQPQVQKVETK